MHKTVQLGRLWSKLWTSEALGIQRGLSFAPSGVVGLKLPVSQGVRRSWCSGRIPVDLGQLLAVVELMRCFLVTTALAWLRMCFIVLSKKQWSRLLAI